MSIFVSIASYRDTKCSITLQNLYKNAQHPNDIYVGICEQNDPSDPDCILNSFQTNFLQNIRIIRIPSYEAQGPTYARYLCSTLYRGEDYYLQIDSHTLFAPGWDMKLKGMIQEILRSNYTSKPVISSYPPSSEHYEKYLQDSTSVPRICETKFNDRGMLSLASSKHINTNKKFFRTPFIAAGFFFCPGSFLKDVPFDPLLPNLFQGEEILLSVRFFTNGWDVFTPNENVLFHLYTREDQPKFWDNKKLFKDEDAYAKVKQYLQLDSNDKVPDYLQKNMDRYGLGTKRTLQEFYNFAGVDSNLRKVSKNFCEMNLVEGYEVIEFSSFFSISWFWVYLLLIVFGIFCIYKFKLKNQ